MIASVRYAIPERIITSLKGSHLQHLYIRWLEIEDSFRFQFMRVFFPIVSRWKLTSSVYYVFSGAFSREHQATLSGMAEYSTAMGRAKSSCYRLRRNIHRLEKALCMYPRRPVFAKDYIVRTVDSYAAVAKWYNGEVPISEEMKWATDVLSQYFESVGTERNIDLARERFEIARRNIVTDDYVNASPRFVPYVRDINATPSVNLPTFLALMQRRRSVRWYLEKPVPRTMIEGAIDAARWAPSACNRQPFRFRIFDDRGLVRELSRLPGGTGGFADGIPVLVFVVGEMHAFFDERDRHLIYIDGALAAMSLALALESQGLASCIINWSDVSFRERKVMQRLKLKASERVVMCMSIGWPEPTRLVPFSAKRSVSDLCHYNFE